ncbi:MAG: FecR domain-containing protein [Bacteroidales bacterium]|nr:FecR domain-containing protein [Bacteroidales bacterium]
MKKDNNINWDLIAKQLSGEASEEENKIVNNWITESEENEKSYAEIKNSWNIIGLADIENEIDVSGALNKVKSKIAIQPRIIHLTRYIRIAAAVLIAVFLGTGIYYYSVNYNQYAEINTKTEQNMVKTLDDGTIVYLNANSKLKYPKKFEKNNREIELTGEAFFEVEPDKNRPFIINTGNSKITVLGTSFNVNAYSSAENTVVTVNTGKVQFSKTNILGKTTENIILEKGQKGILNKSLNQIKADKIANENHLAWRTKIMTFNETPMCEVKQTLESVYQIPVIIEDEEIKNLKFTTSTGFNGDDIKTVIHVIERTLNIYSEFNDGKIIFTLDEKSSL